MTTEQGTFLIILGGTLLLMISERIPAHITAELALVARNVRNCVIFMASSNA